MCVLIYESESALHRLLTLTDLVAGGIPLHGGRTDEGAYA